MKVSISGRKFVTGCPTIFDPTSTKKTTSARAKQHQVNRQTERAKHEPAAKKHCAKKLNFKNSTDNCERDLVDLNKIHHDHLYFCRQEQAIPEDSTVSGDVGLSLGTCSTACQTDLKADELNT